MRRALAPELRSVPEAGLRSLVVAAGSLAAGVLAAGQAETWLGTTKALLLLALVVGGAFLVLFTYVGSYAVLIWPVAATGGYLLQLPRDHPLITFDRVWVGAMIAYIALNPRTVARSRHTRLFVLALLWLVVSYGIRAGITDPGLGGPLATWVDAIVLPAILFFACERYALGGSGRAQRLAGALMLAGGVLAGIGIAERIFGFELATLTGGSVRFDPSVDLTRVSGPYPVPEPYALSLLVCLAATLYWIMSRARGSRFGVGIPILGLQAVAIALVLFRAAWIAAIVVVIAAIGIRPGRFGRAFTVTGIALAVALAATSQLQKDKTFATRTGNTTNIYGRLATYEQGLDLFRSAPAFGVGVNQYHVVVQTRRLRAVEGVLAVSYPHSSYVGLLAEQGLVGFLPFLVLSYGVWRLVGGLRAGAARSRELGVLTGAVAGAALAYAIMSLTLTMLPYEPSNAFFAALLGLASGHLDLVRSRGEETPAPA